MTTYTLRAPARRGCKPQTVRIRSSSALRHYASRVWHSTIHVERHETLQTRRAPKEPQETLTPPASFRSTTGLQLGLWPRPGLQAETEEGWCFLHFQILEGTKTASRTRLIIVADGTSAHAPRVATCESLTLAGPASASERATPAAPARSFLLQLYLFKRSKGPRKRQKQQKCSWAYTQATLLGRGPHWHLQKATSSSVRQAGGPACLADP